MAKTEPLTTERIVELAAEIADSEGLSAVSLTRVAGDLNVQQPALYRHIGGADDLLRRLGLLGRQILSARLADAAIGRARDDAITDIGNAWRQMANDHPGLYAATDRFPAVGDPENEAAVLRVVEIIQQSISSYDLDHEQLVHVARSMRSVFHGFVHLEIGDGHPDPVDLDESFSQLIQLICAGVKAMEQGRLAD